MIVARRLAQTVLIFTGLILSAPACSAIDARLLPEKTEVILTVNLKQILNSELAKSKNVQDLIKQVKLAFNQIPNNNVVLNYLEKTGLDPAKDLATLTITHSASKSPEDVFLIIEGSFNLAKLEATARDAARDFGTFVNVSKINDFTVLELSAGGNGAFLGLLGNKTIVATGSQKTMKEAIDRFTGKKPSVLKKDVEDLLKTMSEKQSIGFVASRRAMTDLGQALGALGPAIPTLDGGLSGSVTFAKEVTFQIGIGAKDAAKARELVDQGNVGLFALRAFLGQIAVQNAQLAPLLDVANSMKLTAMGSSAVLTGEVSYEALEQMFKSIKAAF